MTDTQLKVGIAGYGIVGKRRRYIIDARDDMQVVAVCDQTLDGTGTFDDGVRFYDVYTDLLGESLDKNNLWHSIQDIK